MRCRDLQACPGSAAHQGPAPSRLAEAEGLRGWGWFSGGWVPGRAPKESAQAARVGGRRKEAACKPLPGARKLPRKCNNIYFLQTLRKSSPCMRSTPAPSSFPSPGRGLPAGFTRASEPYVICKQCSSLSNPDHPPGFSPNVTLQPFPAPDQVLREFPLLGFREKRRSHTF